MKLELTGIYKITNTKNGKFYIGSARKSFISRFNTHKSNLKHNKHKNTHLQNSYNKYGLDVFEFEILEYCSEERNILSREQYYIDTLKPTYNITTNVRQPRLGKSHTQATKRLLSEKGKGRKAWNKGLTFSEETKIKMSQSKTGKPLKRNLGLSMKSVIRSDGKEYKNVYFAALDLKVKQNTIIKAITDKKIKRTVKGFTFKYKL